VTALGRLLAELDEGDLAVLAERLAPFLSRPSESSVGGWMGSKEAAAYLGFSLPTLYRRLDEIPHHQDSPRGHLHFLREELDAWRCGAPAGVAKLANTC
jgi:excisionase family DNA binding protein